MKFPFGQKAYFQQGRFAVSFRECSFWNVCAPIRSIPSIRGHHPKNAGKAIAWQFSGPKNTPTISRCWFQICFILTPSWGNDPI